MLARLAPLLLLAAAAAAGAPRAAAAEPRPGRRNILTVDSSAVGQGVHDGMSYVAAGAEGDFHLTGPLWFHLAAARSLAFAPKVDGTATEVTGGARARLCADGARLCPFIGLDLGYQHLDVDNDHDARELHAIVAVPQVGVDLNLTAGLNLRAGVSGRGVVTVSSSVDEPTDDTVAAGVGVHLGVGYLF